MFLPDCYIDYSEFYGVPPLLIESIATIEGGKPGSKVGPNRNKTYDLGTMQINTIWLSELEKYNITEQDLQWDECVNIAVGTWILAKRYNEFDNDWQKAIMSYNAGYILKNGFDYAHKVLTEWNRRSDQQQFHK